MLGTKGLSLIIFTVVNALGVGFLLYVLAQFWLEEHKSRGRTRSRSRMVGVGARPKIVMVMTSIHRLEPRGENGRLIQFPARSENRQGLKGVSGLPGRSGETSKSVAR
jgi:hypothetical protein